MPNTPGGGWYAFCVVTSSLVQGNLPVRLLDADSLPLGWSGSPRSHTRTDKRPPKVIDQSYRRLPLLSPAYTTGTSTSSDGTPTGSPRWRSSNSGPSSNLVIFDLLFPLPPNPSLPLPCWLLQLCGGVRQFGSCVSIFTVRHRLPALFSEQKWNATIEMDLAPEKGRTHPLLSLPVLANFR